MTASAGQPPQFGPDHPSRTSILVAAARAFGAREPDPTVRNPDWMAARLLGPAELQLISEHPIVAAMEEDYETARQRIEVARISNLLIIRTRFIDDHLRRALQNGATQIVILGAGFDTRAYRFQELLKNKKLFEIDYRSTQQVKKRRLQEVMGDLPPHLVLAEIDFKRDTLQDVLRNAGYQPSEKTLFIWEGVSMYLSEEAVRATLRAISSYSAPGSSLLMDFAGQATLDMFKRFPDNPHNKYAATWGEPWTFGVPDRRERGFFRECGLEMREVISLFANSTSKRYLTRTDGTQLGPVRGSIPRTVPDQTGALGRAVATVKVFGNIAVGVGMLLSRRSMWYAVAELLVSENR